MTSVDHVDSHRPIQEILWSKFFGRMKRRPQDMSQLLRASHLLLKAGRFISYVYMSASTQIYYSAAMTRLTGRFDRNVRVQIAGSLPDGGCPCRCY